MSLIQRLFGKKKPAKRAQKRGAALSQTAEVKAEPTSSKNEHKPPKFVKVTTSQPQEAVDILFAKALAVVPVLSDTQFRTAHARMREAWGPLPLVEGSESEVKSVILRNAKALARRADFKHFSIDVCLADQGYQGEEAAQMWSWVGAGALAVHLWKTEDAFHAYGRPELLAE